MVVDSLDDLPLAKLLRELDPEVGSAKLGSVLPVGLVDEVVEAGAHWVDIADASGWVLGILQNSELDERARAASVAVGTGLSTLPALSRVLARWLIERVPQARRAIVVLSIGNRNRKGAAAIASALMSGMQDPSRVETPLGPRLAFRIDAPDEQLLAAEQLETAPRLLQIIRRAMDMGLMPPD